MWTEVTSLMDSAQLSNMLALFKALSDESRLKILGSLASSERSVEELASLLELRAPTVSHHLARLKSLDLVTMTTEGTTHLYRLNIEPLRALSKQIGSVETLAVDIDTVNYDAWQRKILTDFFEGERLKEIPASRKKREVVLLWLSQRFENGKRYTEKEVNQIISRHHPDFATLRRELIGGNLMERKDGIYWLVEPAKPK
jgi:DNA-binding transcriptional ArsR family regulator